MTVEERPLGQEPWPDATAFLSAGEVSLVGRMPWSSNATFLVDVTGEHDGAEATVQAVYKPHQGERPLWDFPEGLYQREVAAYLLSEALGWRIVPPTVVAEGPIGVGSLQWFIDADFEQHYFTLYEQEQFHHQLQAICAFDLVANNTDRKGGHCLIDPRQHIWGIDNGLAFHAEFKLRTVIWEFGGQPVPDDLVDDVVRFLDEGLPAGLGELLDPFERDAIRTRARALVAERTFPVDHTGRRFPWPLV